MSRTRQLIVALIAVSLVTGAFAGTAAAQKATITSGSPLQDGDTEQFDANETEYTTVEFDLGADAEPKVNITLNGSEDGAPTDTPFYINTSAYEYNTTSDSYRVNFSNEELADVPMQTDENVTLDLTIINNSSLDNSDKKTIQFTLVNDKDRSVVYLTSEDDGLTVKNDTGPMGTTKGPFWADYTKANSERDVNGSETNVTVIIGNSTAAQDYSNAVPSSAESGSPVWSMASWVGKTPAKTYYKSAGDDANGTYGVYSSDIGGSTGVTYHLGDTFDDKDEVTVTSYGGKNFDFSITVLQKFGIKAIV